MGHFDCHGLVGGSQQIGDKLKLQGSCDAPLPLRGCSQFHLGLGTRKTVHILNHRTSQGSRSFWGSPSILQHSGTYNTIPHTCLGRGVGLLLQACPACFPPQIAVNDTKLTSARPVGTPNDTRNTLGHTQAQNEYTPTLYRYIHVNVAILCKEFGRNSSETHFNIKVFIGFAEGDEVQVYPRCWC